MSLHEAYRGLLALYTPRSPLRASQPRAMFSPFTTEARRWPLGLRRLTDAEVDAVL
jgi:hypothetical protein